jgi:hypothetical protein
VVRTLSHWLIIHIKKLVLLLSTIALAWGITVYAFNVTELQESTYSPEVEQVNTATTTQPAEETASTTSPIVYTQEMVIEKIKEKFHDAPVMVYVAKCESEWNVSADREHLGVDVGVFQINQVHNQWFIDNNKTRWNIDDNLEYARLLFDRNGLRDWYMSKDCWSKYL